MMIALVMMKMTLISMSTFMEYILLASAHQLGKIDFARGISTCELCNERGLLTSRCKLFHDLIVSKNCDDLFSLAHHNELVC